MAQRVRIGPVRGSVGASRLTPRVFHLIELTANGVAEVTGDRFRSYPLAAPDASKLM